MSTTTMTDSLPPRDIDFSIEAPEENVTLPTTFMNTADSFVLPDLVSACTYPLTYHPQGDKVSLISVNWLIDGLPGLSDKSRKALYGLQGGELASYCYPTCTPERLRIVCDFMSYLFHLDNISDGMLTSETDVLADSVMNALWFPDAYNPTSAKGKEQPKTEIAAGRLARDFWKRCIETAGPGVQARFKENLELYFEAVNTQAECRATDAVMQLEDYIALRRDTSGCKPSFDLMEFAFDIDLPDEVVENEHMKSINEATNDLVTWSNDIFSYNVEQARNDTHNMLVTLMTHNDMTLQQAADYVGDLCIQTIQRFEDSRAQLPSWGPEVDRMVQIYCQGCQDWITASLHWSFQTKRYFGEEGAQVKVHRLVKLYPKKC